MLDWPDPSHTSPIRTSFTTTGTSPALLPAIVISNGPPALSLVKRNIHFPLASAVADLVWPLNLIVIFSAGSAEPQIGTSMPLCNTMWSLNSAEGLTSADAFAAKHIVTQRNAMSERLRELIEFAVGAFRLRVRPSAGRGSSTSRLPCSAVCLEG